MEINFDFKCLSDDFQKYVLEKIGCANYFEFINQYQNNFQLIISPKHSNENLSPKLLENLSPKVSENLIEISLDISENKLDLDNEQFTYFIKDENIYLKTPDTLSKNRKKKLRDNEGIFLKKSNCWSFPLSAKTYVLDVLKPSNETFEVLEEPKEELKTDKNIIQKFYFQDNKAFLIPTSEHPQYGKGVIYDKTGNMGIWSVTNKGWIFQKEN